MDTSEILVSVELLELDEAADDELLLELLHGAVEVDDELPNLFFSSATTSANVTYLF